MTSRPRILLLALDYPPVSGGISRLLNEIVTKSSAEVDWRVVTTSGGPPTTGVFRHRGLASLWGALPKHSRWLARASKRRVVAGHAYMQLSALAVAAMSRAPLATLVYGRELVAHRPVHRIILRSLRRSRRVVAISSHTATVARDLHVDESALTIVTPVFDPSWTVGVSPQLRPHDEPLQLVSIARMTEGYKNLHLLVRLATFFPSDGSIQLTLVGDGPRRPGLVEMARRLGLERIIHFSGQVDDHQLSRVLARSHVGLFPSRYSAAEGGFEGFGLVVQEMASAGLPVLVGRAGGAVEAARPEWSVLLDPDDLAAWASTIYTLAEDEPLRYKMARAAADWTQTADSAATAGRFVDEFLA